MLEWNNVELTIITVTNLSSEVREFEGHAFTEAGTASRHQDNLHTTLCIKKPGSSFFLFTSKNRYYVLTYSGSKVFEVAMFIVHQG